MTMRRAIRLKGKRQWVALWLLLSGCTSTQESSLNSSVNPPRKAEAMQVVGSVVVSVGDGDTFRIRADRQIKTVRLACIDAPERRQPGGTAATDRLKQLLPSGEAVQLRVVDTDRYGRTIAEVYRDHRSVNLQLVQEGLAVIYPPYFDRCANTSRQYLEAEQQAQQRQIGFWQQANAQMPWEWRQTNNQEAATAPTPFAEQPVPSAQALPQCVHSDCNCHDFQTQAEAQRVFATFSDDRFRLDRDGDGRVCERLP